MANTKGNACRTNFGGRLTKKGGFQNGSDVFGENRKVLHST
jgi:hypothetical protein